MAVVTTQEGTIFVGGEFRTSVQDVDDAVAAQY
jgi:hypothetical protein